MLELFRSRRRAVVWFIDAALFGTIVIVAAGLMLGWDRATQVDHLFDAMTITLVAQVSLYYHGLYESVLGQRFSAVSFRIVQALVVACLLVWFVLPWTLADAEDRPMALLATFVLAGLLLPPSRAILAECWALPRFRPRLLVIGSGPLAAACAEAAAKPDSGFRYEGRLVADEEAFLFYDKPDIIGTFSQLRLVAKNHDVRRILVCQSDRRGKLPIEELLELKFRGIEIEEGADFYERLTGKVFTFGLRPSQLVFADGFRVTRAALWTKRLLDIVGAALGLVLALPLMLLTALAIKLESRGPVLYSQERVGAFGRRFSIHKFRSMRIDAEADGLPKFASENDPRVTRVGNFIRRTRIDELPQLWNVLVGDMSLVGPRPERPAFVEQLEDQIPYFHQRLFVKPGVTGHAQVRCRYSAAIEDHQEKLEHDLFYIKNVSVLFDLSILMDTVKVVLLRIGSR
ncbi:MAG: TIGR03013 family PEP-CTERM/XrtA system glycosyltransferase [Polyangiaceae bacterium]|nr:TIGR03013 family PEP-CTERM/XrtA system glycosyltransferase [Polyangiaceae bacterium]